MHPTLRDFGHSRTAEHTPSINLNKTENVHNFSVFDHVIITRSSQSAVWDNLCLLIGRLLTFPPTDGDADDYSVICW